MTATITYGQSILDVALQYLGSAEGCFIVAQKLDVSITGTAMTAEKDAPETVELAGRTFDYSVNDIIDPVVADYYRRNNIVPTTDIEK